MLIGKILFPYLLLLSFITCSNAACYDKQIYLKIVTAKEMQRIESIAFSEGVDEAQLMYNAGLAVANIASQMIEEVQSDKKVILLIGKGNNGGDAYVAGTFLLQRGYNVIAYQLFPRDKSSYLNRLHGDAFIKAGGEVNFISSSEGFTLANDGIIVDGILGTGFKGGVSGVVFDIIYMVNASSMKVVSIDIPSGLNGNNGVVGNVSIKADTTVFFSLPKSGFFMADGRDYVGNLIYADIGLPQKYIDKAVACDYLLYQTINSR
jgi:ADP-dependent NAD(P)H-hydrate dehydratase / NAD(P)H-hydrate epimerase